MCTEKYTKTFADIPSFRPHNHKSWQILPALSLKMLPSNWRSTHAEIKADVSIKFRLIRIALQYFYDLLRRRLIYKKLIYKNLYIKNFYFLKLCFRQWLVVCKQRAWKNQAIMWTKRAAGQHLLIIMVFGLFDPKCIWVIVNQHGWKNSPKKLHDAV